MAGSACRAASAAASALLLSLLVLQSLAPTCAGPFTQSDGGVCAGCTLVTGLVGQLAEVHNETVTASLDRLCAYLPADIQPGCKTLIAVFGPAIVALLEKRETPDVVCHAIELCDGTCHLFPAPSGGLAAAKVRGRALARKHLQGDLPAICKLPGVDKICDLIFGFANNHDPLEDRDVDGFSTLKQFRGSDWRGKDCNDLQGGIHPGAIPLDGDRVVDSNCNGILGVDPASGTPYEDLYCKGTQQRGFIGLGDSATAHFHIPPSYLTATELNEHTFDHLVEILEDEFDWPMLSAGTAFRNTSDYAPDIAGPVNSSYLTLRSRNLCNHRDFQNIGVNGARAGSMNDTIMLSMSRDQTLDQPAFVMYALIGNDVCNGHDDTIAHMTTYANMRLKALGTMRYLDTKLPNGSAVVLTGLADGRILYDNLHDKIHPIGKWNSDVTYSDLYRFLNCLELSPCRGWMNSNETLRNLTTERAVLLSSALQDIVNKETFTNFRAYYVDNPLGEAVKKWNAMGHETWELIEPVDGFHPNQYGQPLIVDVVWEWAAKNHPELLPPINPNNAKIFEQFGDQGGY